MYKKGHAITNTIVAIDSEDNYKRCVQNEVYQCAYHASNLESRTRREEATAEISGEGSAGRRQAAGRHAGSIPPRPRVSPLRARWRRSAPPCGLALHSGAGRPPISRLHYNSGNLQGAGPSRAMFPKVPCDRPTFAATRGYCVPPRASRRACVLRQRARARRMRRLGRNGRALRCFVAIGQTPRYSSQPHASR